MRAATATLTLAVALVGCSESETATPEEAIVSDSEIARAGRATAAAEVFGDGTDPNTAVARVGERTITAGEVAVYLRTFPSLTTEQAVEDLVDIVAGQAVDGAFPSVELRDARVRGRALAWVRRHLWDDPEVATPNPERVTEFMTETRHLTTFGSPELAVVTHVLFQAEGEEQTELRGRNAEILADRIRSELTDMDRPIFGFDLLEAAARVVPEDDPLLDGMEIYSDDTLTFPEEYSGSRRWIGLDSVVPRFGEASFHSPLNQVIGPVLSQYGWHVMVVEERIPADLPPEERIREMAEERTRREQRSSYLQGTIARLLREVPIAAYEDNIGLLALPPEERLRQEAEARGDRFRGE